MKRLFLCIAFIVCVIPAVVTIASAESKADPYLKILARQYQQAVAKGAGSSSDSNLRFLVKTSDPEALRRIVQDLGGRVYTMAGKIATVEARAEAIDKIAADESVEYVEAAKPIELQLDKSIRASNAETLHSSGFDNVIYDGKGVIVGIVDTGIDWRHPVFNDADGNSRIIAIWDQSIESAQGFAAPKEIENSYGIECLRADIKNKTCPSKDEMGHGTHVAGIAAGLDENYEGMAPGAELVVVKELSNTADSFSTSLIDAVNYIMKKGEQEGKPVVINVSMGTQYGAHDGTSLMEQALDAMLDEESGRAIVASAGNYNHQSGNVVASVHASTDLTDGACSFEFLGPSSSTSAILIDVWQRDGAAIQFGIGVDEYGSYEETGMVESGNVYDQTLDDGRLRVVVDSSETANPENGRKHTVIYIAAEESADGKDPSVGNYAFDLMTSGSGAFDAWIVGGAYFTKRDGNYLSSGRRYCPGDSRRTVGIPATAKGVLAVASYATRDDLWPLTRDVGVSGDFTPVDSISTFSSPGPSSDPSRTGQKPEITAPGEFIISALSRDAVNELTSSGYAVDSAHRFVAMAGTSMASPHVAGAIALMLQRKPDLTTDQIKMLLARNATAVDAYPNSNWGYGKLDVLNFFTNFDSTDLQTPLPVSNEDISETPFTPQVLPELVDGLPATNSGGCSLAGESDEELGMSLVYGLILIMIMVLVHRKQTRLCIRMFILGLMLLGASCGGSSSPETHLDQNLSIADSYIKIDIQRMRAYMWMWNADNTTMMRLMIPLKHFFAAETIPLSANNFFSFDADRAELIVMNAEDIDVFNGLTVSASIAHASGAWLSVGGTVTISESSVKDGGRVNVQIEGVEMRPLDRESLMIDREGEATSLTLSSVGLVSEGGSDDLLVTDAEPLNGGLGTKVEFKGFNFTEDAKAHFAGCDDYELPMVIKSQNEAEVTVAAYCQDSIMNIVQDYSYQSGWHPTFIFDDTPDVQISPLPFPEADLLKVLHDPTTDYIYMLFKPGDQLEIYSINDKSFLASKELPVSADTFDVAPDGTIITAQGKTLTVVAPDGTVQAQADIPNGNYVADLTSGPKLKVLVMSDDQSSYTLSGVCILDRSMMSVDCPYALKFNKVWWSSPLVMAVRSDRRIVTGEVDGYVGVYRFEDDDSISKLAEQLIGSSGSSESHLVRDEIWWMHRVYGLDLSELRCLPDSPAYPSPGSERYYVVSYCNISIFDDAEQQQEIPFASCKDDDEWGARESPRAAFVSEGDRYLTVIWNEKIRQVDLSQINTYLSTQ